MMYLWVFAIGTVVGSACALSHVNHKLFIADKMTKIRKSESELTIKQGDTK